MTYCTPIAIVIPLPEEHPRGRGVNATKGYGGNFRIRCTNDEYDLVQEEAALLGISGAMFARCAAVRAAAALRKHREENSQEDEARYDRDYPARDKDV